MTKKILKWILISLLAAIVLGAAGFMLWAYTPLGPQQAALDALVSDSAVSVTQVHGYTVFQPANQQPLTGFIFYPGGRVDYRSYAPPLRKIASMGYLVALVPVRLNLAFFDVSAADKVVKDYPAVQHWAVGGHSLGGVASALYASAHNQIQGIVFWASYPADDSLLNSPIQIVSISGSLDGLANPAKIDASKKLLPAQTRFVQIAGGDHAQFGAYGVQPGDNPAAISPDAQWQQAAEASAALLQSLSK